MADSFNNSGGIREFVTWSAESSRWAKPRHLIGRVHLQGARGLVGITDGNPAECVVSAAAGYRETGAGFSQEADAILGIFVEDQNHRILFKRIYEGNAG